MSILSAKEVIANSPAEKEILSRPDPVCNVLEHTEQNYLIKIFGENVYQELIDDVIDYGEVEVWDDEEDYVLNDLVFYEGIIYKLIVATSESSDTPNCNSEWTTVPKFEKECFNTMFAEGGLLKLLSWVIWAKAAPFYPNVLGITDFIGEDKEYKNKLNFYLSNIYSNIALMEKALFRWNNINKCVQIYICNNEETVEQNQTSLGIAW